MSMAGDFESLLESDSTLATTDITGDCIINRDDVAVALALRLDLSDVPDLDNDGMQTGADSILLIAEAIDNSLGDVDGDGRVDVSDLIEVESRVGLAGANRKGDVNGDKIVNYLDVVKVVLADEPPVIDSTSLAADLYGLVTLLESYDAQGLLDTYNCGDETGPLGIPNPWPDGKPDGHITSISGMWPQEHSAYKSEKLPPNHLWLLSEGWHPCPVGCHGTLNSINEAWPANHYYEISKHWRPQGIPAGPDHVTAVSSKWKPNHFLEISSTWEPPSDHSAAVSQLWPSNHEFAISQNYDPPNHHPQISATHTHNPQVSALWTPNHLAAVSQTWTNHNMEVSQQWPGSHSSWASSTWPSDTYPGVWPPNHNGVISHNWAVPPEEHPGWWPDNHAYISSILDFIPLLGD